MLPHAEDAVRESRARLPENQPLPLTEITIKHIAGGWFVARSAWLALRVGNIDINLLSRRPARGDADIVGLIRQAQAHYNE